jgi:hypothetical protein
VEPLHHLERFREALFAQELVRNSKIPWPGNPLTQKKHPELMRERLPAPMARTIVWWTDDATHDMDELVQVHHWRRKVRRFLSRGCEPVQSGVESASRRSERPTLA